MVGAVGWWLEARQLLPPACFAKPLGIHATHVPHTYDADGQVLHLDTSLAVDASPHYIKGFNNGSVLEEKSLVVHKKLFAEMRSASENDRRQASTKRHPARNLKSSRHTSTPQHCSDISSKSPTQLSRCLPRKERSSAQRLRISL